VKLTPEDQSKLRDRELANIIRKLHAGKTLTAREQAKLDAATAAPGVDPTGYVGTWDELAGRLGVTRKAIQNWRSDPRYGPEIERRKNLLERADGRHCVAAWLGFMDEFRLNRGKGSGEVQDEPENDRDDEPGVIRPPSIGGTQSEWQKAILHENYEKARASRLTVEETLLVAAELAGPLGAFLAALQAKLNQFPDMAARRVCGIADEAECREHLRDEVDAIASDLNLGRYSAEDAVQRAVAEVPFDDSTKSLCEKLLFDGADRTALLELAGAIALQAISRIGQTAIGVARRKSDEDPIEDEEGAELAASSIEIDPSSADGEVAPVPPGKVSGSKVSSQTKATPEPSGVAPEKGNHPARNGQKRRKKARPQPTPPPPAIEAAIVNHRTKATRRRRK